ncbi:MAG: methyl-accepting chemotaxis protein [Porphyrobacter sp.]|nr:methyl-accepting chemotaxis protein [Porphyrobacter sp.]
MLADLGEQSGDISVYCSDTGGQLARLNRQIAAEAERLVELTAAMDSLAASHFESRDATGELLHTAEVAHEVLDRGNRVAQQSLDEVARLIDGVTGLDDELQSFLGRLTTIDGISRTLSVIAEQTQMLSFNARIEAARGGEATRPFEVLADEIRQLANTTSSSAAEVGQNIGSLQETARHLIEGLSANIAAGRKTTHHIDGLRQSLGEMAALVQQFQDRSKAIAGCNDRADGAVETLDAGLREFREVAAESAASAEEARQRLDALETRANDMLNQVAHGGVKTRNTPFIAMAFEGASEITALVESRLGTEELSEAGLFDTDYRPRAGTDPVQFDNGFADFADRHIRPLLDKWTRQTKAVVGCCLVDMNGYLPTHITERSQAPIPGQRLRNLEFSRNRQIFMDNQTRRALDGSDDYFLFAYRQDLGEGRFRALRSVFVPLHFAGRKWGLYEVGYLI